MPFARLSLSCVGNGVVSPSVRWVCCLLITALCAISAIPVGGDEGINALLIGAVNGRSDLEALFAEEPLIDFVSVPAQDQGWGMAYNMKYVRQYFPRTYDQMRDFNFFMLLTAVYYLLSPEQDRWMYDRIVEGAGGYNDESVLAIWNQVAGAWANSMMQAAFPNDAPAVIGRPGGFDYNSMYYRVEIERDFPDPVLTPYIPYGVENSLDAVSRYVIPRKGASVLAWNLNGFSTRIPRLIVWDYERGRTITDGGGPNLGNVGFFGRTNPYGNDMFINMVLYVMQRRLIEDVEVYHGIKAMFRSFGSRLDYLIALADFVDSFGANTEVIQEEIGDLRSMKRAATERYLESDFQGAREAMLEALDAFSEAEALAKRVKDAALWWVYLVEWVATTSVLMISGFLVWTLMVRRRLYRSVATTRMTRGRRG